MSATDLQETTQSREQASGSRDKVERRERDRIGVAQTASQKNRPGQNWGLSTGKLSTYIPRAEAVLGEVAD